MRLGIGIASRRTLCRIAVAASLLALTAGCAVPGWDGGTLEGKSALTDGTKIALNAGECNRAISLIDGVYGSGNTDNEIRMLRAAAYACSANVKFFSVVFGLVANSADLAGAKFWNTMSKIFVTSTTASQYQAAWYATDALMSVIKPGSIITTANSINSGTANPGSLAAADRTNDANIYMMIVSMATIGAIQNVYGLPDANSEYKKTTNLPWSTYNVMDSDGCSYTAAIVNLFEAVNGISTASANFNAALTQIGQMGANIGLACAAGCALCGIADASTACNPCPKGMRNRSSCDKTNATDKVTCAAAGLVSFINTDTVAGWLTR